MRYVEGVPRSEQILWFIDNYVKKEWRASDRRHVLDHRTNIDNINKDREDIGVKVTNCFYEYFFPWEVGKEGYTEVFYNADNITLGELI